MGVGLLKIGGQYKGKYRPVKEVQTLKDHLKYIGYRSREMSPNQERFFDERGDKADWRKFVKETEEHKALKHPSTTKAHKLIFSLRNADYEDYRLSGRDYRDIVRAVMKRYEEHKGIKLEWIAARHDHETEHPHCHVVVRGVSEKGSDGKSRRVFFNKEDSKQLRDYFDNEISRHRAYEYDPAYDEVIREKVDERFLEGLVQLGKSLDLMRRKHEKEAEEKKREEARERSRER